MEAPKEETDQLAEYLDQKYPESHPQDVHISLFYIILQNGISWPDLKSLKSHLPTDIQIKGCLQQEWPNFWVVECETNQTQREIEEMLNISIRRPLRETLTQDPKNPPQILIGRICKYTSEVSGIVYPREVEKILTNSNDDDQNQHLDYFYLFIKLPGVQRTTSVLDIPTVLKHLPGRWRAVRPDEAWPMTFLGYFPKIPFESEREREWRLHKEVRVPLKEHLQHLLKLKKVQILFTRACKYSSM